MIRDLEGKTAMVTGSGKRSGIGYAIASKLAASGANVIIADLGNIAKEGGISKIATSQEMVDIANELHSKFNVETMEVSVDVADTTSVEQIVPKIRERFEHVEILCNNAGTWFGGPSAIHTYDEADWLKTFDVNLHGVFRVTRAILPLMIGTPGSIVNTASRAGKVPPLFNGAYAVSKAGVIMLTKVMAKELAGDGIRVNAICPGQIMTDLEKSRFAKEAQFFNTTIAAREAEMCKTIPLNRIGLPADVGNVVAFLASEKSSYCTGQAINITGGQLMEV